MTPKSIATRLNLTRNGSCLQKAGRPNQIHEKSALDSDEGKSHSIGHAVGWLN